MLSVALAACGASQPLAPPVSNRAAVVPVDAAADAAPDVALTGAAAAIAKLQQLADDMCRCPDRDCADQVVDEMAHWAQELAQAGEATPRVNSAEDTQARAATERMAGCMSQIYRRHAGSGSGTGSGSDAGTGSGAPSP